MLRQLKRSLIMLRSVARWRRSRRGAVSVLSTALALTLAPSAGAQLVTSTGLQCGGSAIPLDAIEGPTLGANLARLSALDRLYTYARAAAEACEPTKREQLPGCSALLEWRQHVEFQAGLTPGKRP